MSEFKFNCPVCGQHIATDSTASGVQIECPTCFQPIIVPQAPKADSKFILSATQYIKPQPVPRPSHALPPRPGRRKLGVAELFLGLLVAGLLGVAAYVLYSKNSESNSAPLTLEPPSNQRTAWRADLANVPYPEEVVNGKIHDKDFSCERAYVQNGALALRQGPNRQPDLLVNVYFSIRDSRQLAGQRFEVGTNDAGTAPHIVLRWKEKDLRVSQTFTNGYAMKLAFGRLGNDRLTGKIYLCLPDDTKSVIAGTFAAELRPSPDAQH